ncbi:MAG: ArsR family transcriptional regulator [Actinobacteria bacterium]|jgi:DNA-binding MarR family transcriptional regulator|nr:transcriptional regulator [Actinomycetota bacterium]PLS87181.1 MAG: ArsR family transcriptional regulator [Actinomycetota bacterium]
MAEQPFEELAGLDRLIHEPARLAIMTALSASAGTDFLFLQRLTGLTKGNLSSHLSKLEGAGLVRVKKRFVGKRPNTTVSLTEEGRAAIDEHWRRLEKLREVAREWRRH